MPQKRSDIIDFAPNVPVTLTLSNNPAEAKRGEKDGQYGHYVFWTLFTKEGGVFWPREELYGMLQQYKPGDKVTITKVVAPGERGSSWKVEAGGTINTKSTQVEQPDRVYEKLLAIEALLKQALEIKGMPGEVKPMTPEQEKASLGF